MHSETQEDDDDENEEEELKTPQKPSFFHPKLKTTVPMIKKEEKMPINFRNYCPEMDNEYDHYANITYSFPRQEKKENPYWQRSMFCSEKKATFHEKMNNTSINLNLFLKKI